MNDRNRQLKKYYGAIKSWLPGSAKQNKLILEKIRDRIDAYAEENPEVGVDEIKQHFGTPRQIAAACVDEMGMEELLNSLRNRKKVLGAVRNVCLCAVAILLLLIILSIPVLIRLNLYQFQPWKIYRHYSKPMMTFATNAVILP